MGMKANAIREHNAIHSLKEERAIKISQYLDEAADLMELYEQGLLVRLPCKVGDVVYALVPIPFHDSKVIVKGKVARFSNIGEGLSDTVIYNDDNEIASYMFGYVGDDIFANREEAEAALAKED